jgi:hypothetical protein
VFHETPPKSINICRAVWLKFHYPWKCFAAILVTRFAVPSVRGDMKNEEERELRADLERLRQEHRDLDAAIDALLAATGCDRLQVQRLKKRKLQIRDQIAQAEDKLFPDIIA